MFVLENLPSCDNVDKCVEKAREIVAMMKVKRLAEQVSIIRYTDTKLNHIVPKIFLKDLTQARLPNPSTEIGRTKLAALLYCIGRILDVDPDILIITSEPDHTISTKHPRVHGGKLQKNLDKALIPYLKTGRTEPSSEDDIFVTSGISLSPEEKVGYSTLHAEEKERWLALAKISDKNRHISNRMLNSHCKRTESRLERIFTLNENVLRPTGLAFDIEYGSIPFIDHMEEIEALQEKIREIRKQLPSVPEIGEPRPTQALQPACEAPHETVTLQGSSEAKQIEEAPKTDLSPKTSIPPEALDIFGKIFEETKRDDGTAFLSILGYKLRHLNPPFDWRAYGYSKLLRFVQALGGEFEISDSGADGAGNVRIRRRDRTSLA